MAFGEPKYSVQQAEAYLAKARHEEAVATMRLDLIRGLAPIAEGLGLNLDDLTRAWAAANRVLDRAELLDAEAFAHGFKAALALGQPASPVKPKLSDFDFDEAKYDDALIAWRDASRDASYRAAVDNLGKKGA